MAGLAEKAKNSVWVYRSWIWRAHNPCGVAWHLMDWPPGHLMMHVVPWNVTVQPAWVRGCDPYQVGG
jgi:hypothetical protein